MKSKHFRITELVPLQLKNMLHEDALWSLIDDDLIQAIDGIKEMFNKGSITINSYMWSGDRNQSGIRTKDSKYYSKNSQHSIGKAVDMVFSAYTTDEVRDYILSHQDEFPLIGGIELGVAWLHVDTRPRRDGKIITFRP
jgi:uncharacterized protein YcbK (DUF882 family)